jgi:glutamine synthetase
VNPYLFLAAVLGSALVGIEDGMTPPAPITGNAYDQKLPQVPSTWVDAIDRFEQSALARRIFDPQLVDNLVRTKRQEMQYFAEMTPEEQLDHYLDLV